MGRARHNPFRGVMDTFSEMNRMREQRIYGGQEAGHEEQPRTHATAWIPTTDIFAAAGDLVIRCELAGVSRQDIDIILSGGALVISGSREMELDEEETNFLVRERFYGAFRRSITVPEGVDEDDLNATFSNGMLEVTIKDGATAHQPRRIQIQER